MNRSSQPPEEQTYKRITEFAQSSKGHQLLRHLEQADPQRVRQAMAQAESGDMDQLKSTVEQLLRSPQIQALLKQYGGEGSE
jgi:flagellar motor switch protein FliG